MRSVVPSRARPALARLVTGLSKPADDEWSYCPQGWEDTDASVAWNHPSVSATMTDNWRRHAASVVAPSILGKRDDGSVDVGLHNTLVTFGFVVAEAATSRARLRVLDWGGGVAPYFTLAAALLPELELDYHCADVPSVNTAGRRLQPEVTFHDEDTWERHSFDLVVSSSSLQYMRDWRSLVSRLAAVAEHRLFITRLPIVDDAPSFVVRQRPHQHGYATEYQGWCLNRQELLAAVDSHGLRLRREFHVAEQLVVPGAPAAGRYAGFLFGRTNSAVPARSVDAAGRQHP